MTLKIGDIVSVKKPTLKGEHYMAFVEEVLFTPDFKLERLGQQVSLYRLDGEYLGDHFENELTAVGRAIDVLTLKSLIREAVSRDHWGLVLDFARVLLVMEGKVHA